MYWRYLLWQAEPPVLNLPNRRGPTAQQPKRDQRPSGPRGVCVAAALRIGGPTGPHVEAGRELGPHLPLHVRRQSAGGCRQRSPRRSPSPVRKQTSCPTSGAVKARVLMGVRRTDTWARRRGPRLQWCDAVVKPAMFMPGLPGNLRPYHDKVRHHGARNHPAEAEQIHADRRGEVCASLSPPLAAKPHHRADQPGTKETQEAAPARRAHRADFRRNSRTKVSPSGELAGISGRKFERASLQPRHGPATEGRSVRSIVAPARVRRHRIRREGKVQRHSRGFLGSSGEPELRGPKPTIKWPNQRQLRSAAPDRVQAEFGGVRGDCANIG